MTPKYVPLALSACLSSRPTLPPGNSASLLVCFLGTSNPPLNNKNHDLPTPLNLFPLWNFLLQFKEQAVGIKPKTWGLLIEKEGEEQKTKKPQARAYLVADRLVLEPWFVQDHFQQFVIEIGHPNGLG